MESKSPHSPTNGFSADEDAAAARSRAAGEPGGESARSDDPWKAIGAHWKEFQEYAGYYLAANIDRLRVGSRVAAMWAVLAVMGVTIAVFVVATASVLFVNGLANAVGRALWGEIWAGQLVVGGSIVLLLTVGTWLVLTRQLRKFRARLVEKYERRKQRERVDYGTDVEQRANEQREIG